MRICIRVWMGDRWRWLTVESRPDVDGIELVGFPPTRARAIRDRIYALLVAASTPEAVGLVGRIDPPLSAGATGGLDRLIAAMAYVAGACGAIPAHEDGSRPKHPARGELE